MGVIRNIIENERIQPSTTPVANTIPVRDTDIAIAGKNQCTAFVVFDGTTNPPTIRDSFNVGSVVNSSGYFDINFSTIMDKDYSVVFSSGRSDTYGAISGVDSGANRTNTHCRVWLSVSNNLTGTAYMSAVIFGGKN